MTQPPNLFGVSPDEARRAGFTGTLVGSQAAPVNVTPAQPVIPPAPPARPPTFTLGPAAAKYGITRQSVLPPPPIAAEDMVEVYPGGPITSRAALAGPPPPTESGAPPASAPRPVAGGFGGIPPSATPFDVFQGGHLYPETLDEALGEIETARLQGLISDQKAEELRQKLPERMRAQQQSPEGLIQQGQRRSEAGAQERGDIQLNEAAYYADQQDQKAEALAGLQRNVGQRFATAEQQRRIVRQRQEQEYARYLGSIKAMEATSIDPMRSMRGANGVLARIAMALGAIPSSYSHTPNQAMEKINADINRDVQAQMADLDTKKAAVAARESVLGQLRSQLGDIDAAQAAYKAYAYDQFALWTKQQGAQSANQFTKARAGEMESRLREQADNFRTELALNARVAAIQEEQRRLALNAAAVAAKAKEGQLAWRRIRPDERSRIVPGLNGIALTDKDADELKGIDAGRRNVKQGLARMNELKQQYGTIAPGSTESALYESAKAQVIDGLKALNKGGALDDGAVAHYGGMISTPTGTHSPELMQQVAGAVDYAFKANADARGYLPAQMRAGRNEKGDVEEQIVVGEGEVGGTSGDPIQMGAPK